MESLKQLLVPEVTLTILRQLAQRKLKQDVLKKQFIRWGIIFFAVFMIGCIYVIMAWYTVSMGKESYSDMIKNPLMWIVVFIVSGTYLQFFLTKKSFEEAEEEYEALRLDIMNRSTELWSTEEQWEKRHLVFEFMKEHFDINLYYE